MKKKILFNEHLYKSNNTLEKKTKMEQLSVTHSANQSVDYLGQTHSWTDTDVISSYKMV
jgi:hypothetical protein